MSRDTSCAAIRRTAFTLAAAALTCTSALAQSSYGYIGLKASSGLGASSPVPVVINNKGVVAGSSTVAINPRWTFSYLYGFYLKADAYKTVGSTWSRTGAITLLDKGTGSTILPSLATAINSNGAVAGIDGQGRPVLVSSSGVKTVLAEGSGSAVYGINDKAAVVGRGYARAALWNQGQALDLHPANAPDVLVSEATSINNLDQITLIHYVKGLDALGTNEPAACFVLNALNGGQTRQALDQQGGRWCTVRAINDNGTAIGQITKPGATNATFDASSMVGVVWQGNAAPQRLPLPPSLVVAPGTSVRLEPKAINKSGVIVGDIVTTIYTTQPSGLVTSTYRITGFVHKNGQTSELGGLLKGLPKGTFVSSASSINDEGRIVVSLGGVSGSTSSVGVLTPNP